MDFKAKRAAGGDSGRDRGGWTMVAQEACNLVPTSTCDKSQEKRKFVFFMKMNDKYLMKGEKKERERLFLNTSFLFSRAFLIFIWRFIANGCRDQIASFLSHHRPPASIASRRFTNHFARPEIHPVPSSLNGIDRKDCRAPYGGRYAHLAGHMKWIGPRVVFWQVSR